MMDYTDTEVPEFSNPLQIVVMNVTITLGLFAVLKVNGFGWLATLFIGSFGGACITIGALYVAFTLFEMSQARRADERGLEPRT